MPFGRSRAADPDQAPPFPRQLPWGSRHDSDLELAEPPRPLAITADLTEEDVQAVQTAAVGKRLSVPIVLALVVYFALKTYFGDDIPDVLLYVLLGGTFLLNTLLAMRKNKDHYARPGRLTLTLSADGVEVSSEGWAGHVPWVLIDRLEVVETLLLVQTATKPAYHVIPIAHLDGAALANLQVWLAFGNAHRRRRPGRTLFVIAVLALLAFAIYWLWDQIVPLLPFIP